MKRPSVMIVEDEQLLADLLSACLASQLNLSIVGCARCAAEAYPLATQTQPELILLDIQLPGTSGLEMIAPLRAVVPTVKILMLSAYMDPHTIYRVIQSDVQGYVEKPSPLSVVTEAVQRVLAGCVFFSPGFLAVRKQYLASAEAFHKILSTREQEVLRLVVGGFSDPEIAAQCRISEHTVSVHRKNTRRKLDVHSDRELLAYARRWGLGPKDVASAWHQNHVAD
ncbi:MAG: response regulator transcription factor [Verrucomicrobia bacterium]|nr:MAG: response regulator transcription factor [Verrucomicrobiota bacterium]